MLLSNGAYVTWNSKNKRHYVELGYEFTNMGDSFWVNIEDLTSGSSAVVTLKCDYCGKEYLSTWYKYKAIKNRSKIDKDACIDCCELKCEEAICLKYGSYAGMHRSTDGRRRLTNIQRYGVDNPFGNASVKEKIVQTNMGKYGVPYSQQSNDVRQKTIATCMQKYGVENYIELFKGKFIGENSPCWKGGAEYSRVERATHEYIQWRNNVFAKDNYTCQCCGDCNGDGHTVTLNAHHIRNWKDNEFCRYDIDNGITLCEHCHMNFHSIYGKRNNTPEQLIEFLNKDNVIIDEEIC